MKEQNTLIKIDVKAGHLTYGQRIELGDLFASEKSDTEKFNETFRIMHDITPDFSNPEEMKIYSQYYKEIIDGLVFWFEKEKHLLDYQPEPEEIRAGIKELSAKTGYYGTIKAIAKNYAKDPDEILQWKYGKIFGILYSDLEELKYSKRLRKQYEKK
ncbi:MAG: hypothetical protein LBG15_09300 [Dysgonamonadaceae bacterium]|jgi:hypothetical protein|nr:hypothetical protein [Dysgonamonadaceae bacterium]